MMTVAKRTRYFETEAPAQTAMTRDNLESARAFFEKREPGFTGE